MATHHVLLIGGHGKIAQLLTPLLLRRSWDVTSIIRKQEQVAAVQKLGDIKESNAGKLNVLVHSVEDIKEESEAKAILDEVTPDYVVWSAGAGGKGGAARTYAVDRDAAICFIRASAATPSIKRFLLVSYLTSRANKPSWWPDSAWDAAVEMNKTVFINYYKAKIAADKELYRVSKERGPEFVGIDLRPGALTDEPAGPVELGKTKRGTGPVSRESVARVADLLLAKEGVKNCWIDLVNGEEDADKAVDRVVAEDVNAAEGEPWY
ncbi:hypothetical protein QBC38DRAFT_478120 [Podospora fimiseda]|uniref:NAD(P)-binding domain-containing protein n=1 Tax=Podospora fimiseda TaxID=252190 RepID=A0AAN7GUJ6_9PEZI|nr:hypothetical protein QBC38DRAFT_478120 [Podospora fimiseda]